MELILIALMAFIVFGFFYLGVRKFSETKMQKNAEQILDQKFNGSETATYKVHGSGGLRFEQVLEGAEKRGYALHAQNEQNKMTTLVFKKAA